METHNNKSASESLQHICSKGHYFEDLIILEAERVVIEALALVNYARGFSYLEPTAAPVVPLDEHCYLPTDMASIEERWQIGLERDVRAHQLTKEFGDENVWLGPPAQSRPTIPRLTVSEQRGFWVRFA